MFFLQFVKALIMVFASNYIFQLNCRQIVLIGCSYGITNWLIHGLCLWPVLNEYLTFNYYLFTSVVFSFFTFYTLIMIIGKISSNLQF